jgi:hypothetical protein
MRNTALSGTELLAELGRHLRERLPPTWRLALTPAGGAADQDVDAWLQITPPSGRPARLAIEFKPSVQARDVPVILQRLNGTPAAGFLVAAPFIGPRAREVLAQSGLGYADATGNLRLALDKPPLFVELAGADSNPWRQAEAPLKTLKGPGAARVVRGLCDFRPPYGVRELAGRCAAPPSTTSRVVELLDREALLTREDGRITSVAWPGLLRRWVRDYSLVKSNRTRMYLDPRGLPALLNKLQRADWTYAVTASLAAVRRAPLAAPRLAVVYVPELAPAAERLELSAADTGANVMLVEPLDSVAFDRTWRADGVNYAALPQVVADLWTSPGRAPSEGEELIHWMEANEDAWRS